MLASAISYDDIEVPTVRLGYFLPQMGPAAGPDAILQVARRAE